ncbi:DUF4325 domain-containing protein [Candidatus Dojkabacteria bacterium]|nr:DUF4325 domain-containing protein [Candidatus Dojkabacteria bacterium]
MKTIGIKEQTGTFAENKDIAKQLRLDEIIPILDQKESIILDFSGIEATTQSFIHALISDLFRKFGVKFLEKVQFKGCNDSVKGIIEIVVDYMQEGLAE